MADGTALGVPLSISQARYYGYECLDCGHRYLRQAEIQVCTKCKSTNGRLVKIVSNLLDLVEWRCHLTDGSADS